MKALSIFVFAAKFLVERNYTCFVGFRKAQYENPPAKVVITVIAPRGLAIPGLTYLHLYFALTSFIQTL